MLTIAIQPDDYTSPATPDKCDASSPRWAELLDRAGFTVRWVNVYRADILDQLRGCQGFMWRWAHFGGMWRIAHRLLPALERQLNLVVYPDQNTCWHYDDKIAQRYILEAAGIPIPKTWVWFDRDSAKEWARSATFPLVMKLHGGAGSTNVRLVRSYIDVEPWIDAMFETGVGSMHDEALGAHFPWAWRRRFRAAAKAILLGRPPMGVSRGSDVFRGYVLFQEFLPDNEHDTRVTVIGKHAFAFRRFNRTNDFRASGSGKIDFDPAKLDLQVVRLAYEVAARLKTQSVAMDGLLRGKQPVVGEISYTYASWAVHDCPGHWELAGDPETGELRWVKGNMWPEEAQIEDFLKRIRERHGT